MVTEARSAGSCRCWTPPFQVLRTNELQPGLLAEHLADTPLARA